MSYHFFGNFNGKPAEEVIVEAHKQKKAEDVVSAVLSPLHYVARNGAKVITGSTHHVVSEENYITALILKVLKENNLAPQARLKRSVRKIILDVLDEHNLIAPHPHWASELPKKK